MNPIPYCASLGLLLVTGSAAGQASMSPSAGTGGRAETTTEAELVGATPPAGVHLTPAAEIGFLSPLRHTIQFSQSGSRINYRQDAAQDTLFPFTRWSVRLDLGRRHSVTALYQPLKLVTNTTVARDLTVDDEVFAAGTPMRFTYGFPFWRAGYGYDLLASERHDLRLGAALQIRNATIEFASLDGEQLVSNRDVGPVPLLHAFGRATATSGAFVETEVDGFYAPIKYINGADSDVVGAIVDWSFRAGIATRYDGEVFVNLRYLGGGAEGTSEPYGGGDGFTKNWLHFMTLSLGARLRLL